MTVILLTSDSSLLLRYEMHVHAILGQLKCSKQVSF